MGTWHVAGKPDGTSGASVRPYALDASTAVVREVSKTERDNKHGYCWFDSSRPHFLTLENVT